MMTGAHVQLALGDSMSAAGAVRTIICQQIECLGDVLRERVIEIKPNCFDLVHVEGTVAEDPPADFSAGV